MEQNLQFADITRKVMGCAMKVHTYPGMGFPEKIYQRCLILELKKAGLRCEWEVDRVIVYDGKTVGKRKLDIIVENAILIELKAVSELDKSCYNQLLNYLKIFGLEVGLLFNFRKPSLEFKRLVFWQKSVQSFLIRKSVKYV